MITEVDAKILASSDRVMLRWVVKCETQQQQNKRDDKIHYELTYLNDIEKYVVSLTNIIS